MKTLNLKTVAFATLATLATALVSCEQNEPESANDNEYAVRAKLQVSYSPNGTTPDKAQIAQLDSIVKAAGMDDAKFEAKNTEELKAMITPYTVQMQNAAEELGINNTDASVLITAVNKKYADEKYEKNHPWVVLDKVVLAESYSNSDHVTTYAGESKKGASAWVHGITTEGYWSDLSKNEIPLLMDFNKDAHGDYIYPVFQTDGYDDNWVYQDRRYITDIIAVYGGDWSRADIVIDGRHYTRECSKDLNKGAGGEYIWFFSTRDYYDGRYLWVGGPKGDHNPCPCGCRAEADEWSLSGSAKSFNASDYLHQPYKDYKYDVVERVVQAYDLDGNHLGEAEFNKGAGGAYIKMIMAYRKH